MRRILVTAISGDIGNGILKILKDTDCVLFGCDVNKIAVGMDLVSEFKQCRYASEEGYVQEILDFCTEKKITHVIPVNEREIETLSPARNLFEAIGIKLVIQSEKILKICLDKYNTAKFLSEQGLCVPATFLSSENLEDNKKYIQKPRCSNGSKNIETASGLELKKQTVTDGTVFQEYIDSEDEYTIGVFRQNSITNVITFKRQLKNGYSNQVELVSENEFRLLAMRVADAFDLTGYINIQLRKSAGNLMIFEINPRISGTVRFRHMLGFSDVLWWLNLLDGIDNKEYKCEYTEAIGVRELNEKFLIMK